MDVFLKKKMEITFYFNGKSMGVCYAGIDKADLFPAFDFDTNGGEIEFVKPKFK